MSQQPAPVTHRIRSDYPDKPPPYVAKWEKWVNDAPTDNTALLQLIYFQALQIRTIKILLAWMLVGVPIITLIVAIVVIKGGPATANF